MVEWGGLDADTLVVVLVDLAEGRNEQKVLVFVLDLRSWDAYNGYDCIACNPNNTRNEKGGYMSNDKRWIHEQSHPCT